MRREGLTSHLIFHSNTLLYLRYQVNPDSWTGRNLNNKDVENEGNTMYEERRRKEGRKKERLDLGGSDGTRKYKL